MKTPLNCIMLVDDNKTDNFFHERVIRKYNAATNVIAKESAQEALDHLKNKKNNESCTHPDLIFLDINMPGMNGWEFMEHYRELDSELQSEMVVVMLTTSQNPDDKATALSQGGIIDFKTKPLSKEILDEVLQSFYSSK
ncbi:response regulator [Flavobacterium rhizosphaerae]|uniref:Response regulator n=1 Tax=Flavobacterium rhizosphaerae TaxID=3163298 RepID=A0ABW8Z204_9FLAO